MPTIKPQVTEEVLKKLNELGLSYGKNSGWKGESTYTTTYTSATTGRFNSYDIGYYCAKDKAYDIKRDELLKIKKGISQDSALAWKTWGHTEGRA